MTMRNHAMKKLDLTKPLQTVGGDHAELVYNGLTGPYPLAVVVHFNDGTRDIHTYQLNGMLHCDKNSPENLRNVPQRGECWVNIYPDGTLSALSTRERADEYARHGRIACVRVEYEEGEGL